MSTTILEPPDRPTLNPVLRLAALHPASRQRVVERSRVAAGVLLVAFIVLASPAAALLGFIAVEALVVTFVDFAFAGLGAIEAAGELVGAGVVFMRTPAEPGSLRDDILVLGAAGFSVALVGGIFWLVINRIASPDF